MQQMFEALVQQSPILIWRADTTGLCDFFNATWLAFTGRTMAQELGNGWAEGVHPDDLPACMATYTAKFSAREAFQMEYRLRRHDGAYRWILDHGCPFYDQGAFLGYIGSCTDVTDRHVLDEERRKIHRATLQGANHVLRNALNNLQIIGLECERVPELHRRVSSTIDGIIADATDVLDRLGNVAEVTEEGITRSYLP